MGPASVALRQRPSASNCSSEKPSGSIRTWQVAQAGFLRCASICSRWFSTRPGDACSSEGTSGGGGGGGDPSTVSRSQRPRSTGDVRFGYDVAVSTLACPSSPPRTPSANVTRRKWLP